MNNNNNNSLCTLEIVADLNEARPPIQYYDRDVEQGTQNIDEKISKHKTGIPSVRYTQKPEAVRYQNGTVGQSPNRSDAHPEMVVAGDRIDNAPIPATMEWEEQCGPLRTQKRALEVIPGSSHTKCIGNSSDRILNDRSSLKSYSSSSFVNASGKGLAVACPVTDQNEPIYEATEYDPSAKVQLRKTIRCRVYTAMALLMMSTLVAVAAFFATRQSSGDVIAQMPTMKPTTYRESKIQEMLKDNVLQRNVSFKDMKSNDPRLLALEWLLSDDRMQLSHSDSNVMQRYILALLAFSFDLYSWDCGMVNGLASCNMTDYDGNDGNWLSRTDECMWWGVSCGEGAVKKIDLCEQFTMNYSMINPSIVANFITHPKSNFSLP